MEQKQKNQPLPPVTFDISLGEKVPKDKQINFDYGRYAEVGTDMGLSPEQIAQAPIEITNTKGMGPSFKEKVTRGSYNTKDQQIRVNFNKKDLSGTLVHELQHHADYTTGNVPEDRWAHVERFNGTRKRAIAYLLGGVAMLGMSQLVNGYEWLAIPGAIETAAGLINIQPSKGSYEHDMLEIRAREAAKKYGKQPIVSIGPAT